MKRNYYQDDEMEQRLREELIDEKMYPSEQVWENIRTEIHGNTAWPALSFTGLFLIIILTIFTVYNYPPKKIIDNPNYSAAQNKALIDRKENRNLTDNTKPMVMEEDLRSQMDPNHYTNKAFEKIKDSATVTAVVVVENKTILTNNLIAIKSHIDIEPNTSPIKNNKSIIAYQLTDATNNQNLTNSKDGNTYSNHSADLSMNSLSKDLLKSIKNKVKTKNTDSATTASLNPENENPVEDSYLKDFGYEAVKNKKQLSRWAIQYYFTPSVSYRKLADDEIRLNYMPSVTTSSITNVPILSANSQPTSINTTVRHTPALGIELGSNILYTLTPIFKLKTGLQFNIREYFIDASQSFGIATIAFVQNNRLDSVTMFSTLGNNINGINSTKINTKLYQISIPIGFQLDLIQGKKLGISASASIQPTFTLNKNVYMLSTDYKFYTNGADFFRKWNFNTSADLNITYKIGDLKWSVGPQIRYQHLPTYTDIYPIKEYRWDYGLKIGVTAPINK